MLQIESDGRPSSAVRLHRRVTRITSPNRSSAAPPNAPSVPACSIRGLASRHIARWEELWVIYRVADGPPGYPLRASARHGRPTHPRPRYGRRCRGALDDSDQCAVPRGRGEGGRVRVLERGRLSQGPETAHLEAECAAFVGTRHAVATSSGTEASTSRCSRTASGPATRSSRPPSPSWPPSMPSCTLARCSLTSILPRSTWTHAPSSRSLRPTRAPSCLCTSTAVPLTWRRSRRSPDHTGWLSSRMPPRRSVRISTAEWSGASGPGVQPVRHQERHQR